MWQAFITGITMGLYLAISVGPILFTVIKQSLESGIRGGFSFVAGIWLSDILFVVLSNTFTVFTAHFADTYIKQIGYGGGLLLFALGGYYAFFKPSVLVPLEAGMHSSIRRRQMATLFITGFFINTLNPILFFEWLTAATIFANIYTANERLLIFSVCLLVNMGSDVLKVVLAGKIRPRLTISNLQVINRLTGAVLIVCGSFILYQTFYHSDQWGKKVAAVHSHLEQWGIISFDEFTCR
jgi:threonine/homoserine/homoserine lactone efflux protein